ncbi:MAG: DUF4307 domain-containing protein [Streptosporangiaceae bacterium]
MAEQAPADVKKWLGYGVIGLVTVIFAGGWAYVMGNTGQTPGIETVAIGYRVASDSSMTFTFQIDKPKGEVVKCVATALSQSQGIVGTVDVTARSGKSRSVQRITLPTTSRAITAELRGCSRS